MIEKVFAIQAAPRAIYDAIERDLASASEHEGAAYDIVRRDPPGAIDLRVTIGNVPCMLEYRIVADAADGSEVTARLEPYGFKYNAFRLMTFGMSNQGFEVALVQSLANLKAAVEDEASA
jgi:hypothetical protein